MEKRVKWVNPSKVSGFGFGEVNEELEREIVVAAGKLPVVEGYEVPVRSLSEGCLVVVVRNERFIVELVDWRWGRVVREVVGEVITVVETETLQIPAPVEDSEGSLPIGEENAEPEVETES